MLRHELRLRHVVTDYGPTSLSRIFPCRYDPYVPKPGSSGRVGGDPAGGRGNDQINRAQLAVDEATGVMRENIKKVTERGERMDDLKTKTGEWPLTSLFRPSLLLRRCRRLCGLCTPLAAACGCCEALLSSVSHGRDDHPPTNETYLSYYPTHIRSLAIEVC